MNLSKFFHRAQIVLVVALMLHRSSAEFVEIADASAVFEASNESTFDHMAKLEDNLYFHWNDAVNNKFQGRLMHTADSESQAPTWLGFGVYHSNHNYNILPVNNFMVGSEALIGMVYDPDDESHTVQRYLLEAKDASRVNPSAEEGTLSSASMFQHISDDGKVTTDMTFALDVDPGKGTIQNKIRSEGTNVFLWAIGAPGSHGVLTKHVKKGVFFLDFKSVRYIAQERAGLPTQADASPTLPPIPVEAPTPNTAPIVIGECSSSVLDGGGHVSLTPSLTFHWKLISSDQVQIALENVGPEAWLGVGSSFSGRMIGSNAVIGIPGRDQLAMDPTQYILSAKDSAGVVPDPSATVTDGSITTSNAGGADVRTVMKFVKQLEDSQDRVPLLKSGLNTFLYAVGSNRDLAYHEHRGTFQLSLDDCGGSKTKSKSKPKVSVSSGSAWKNSKTFVAHGFFAMLAWALLSPVAVTIAWFRTLLPSSWIYIHVFSNVISFICSFLAFWIAVGGVAKNDAADHFSKGHHYGGLILFFFITLQTINGFLRPPVERKDANSAYDDDPDLLFGCVRIPQTPRETWQMIHRTIGLGSLGLGIYQVSSGLGLYSERFGTKSLVWGYFIYVGLFVASLVALRMWTHSEEDKARRGGAQVVSSSDDEPDLPQMS